MFLTPSIRIPFLHRAVLCTLLGVSAIAGAQTTRFTAQSTDGEPGYSFDLPQGWTQKNDLPRPMIAFLAPEERDYRANFSVNLFDRVVKPSEERAFLQNIAAEYKKQKTPVTTQTKIPLAGGTAWRWSATISAPNFPQVENQQVVCFRNHRAYILTFTYLPALRGKYLPVCNRLFASFRFGKTPTMDKRGHTHPQQEHQP